MDIHLISQSKRKDGVNTQRQISEPLRFAVLVTLSIFHPTLFIKLNELVVGRTNVLTQRVAGLRISAKSSVPSTYVST